MNDLLSHQHQAQIDFHDKIEGILSNLETPTRKIVEKTFNDVQPPNITLLMQYCGYYSMDISEGAFLSIDTVEACYQFSEHITITVPSVTVSVSLDGKTSATYPFDNTATFDGKILTIGDVRITLTRQYNNGILTAFVGTVGNEPITGVTRFNPITLPTFIGNYIEVPSLKKVLLISDSAIAFDFGSGLREVKYYTFTPLMFVLMFSDPDTAEKYVLMLGTSGSMGLACFIQHGSTGVYALTIPVPQRSSLQGDMSGLS